MKSTMKENNIATFQYGDTTFENRHFGNPVTVIKKNKGRKRELKDK